MEGKGCYTVFDADKLTASDALNIYPFSPVSVSEVAAEIQELI